MRTGPLSLLLTALLFSPWLAAEELPLPAATPASSVTPASTGTGTDSATGAAPAQASEEVAPAAERDNALLSRLRQENQRLKLKLKQAEAQQPNKLLSEQQMWFAVGAGTALLAFIVGRLSSGRRNKRQSQWV